MYLFETMRVDDSAIPRINYHKKRLSKSAKQLGFKFNLNDLEAYVTEICRKHNKGIWRLKVKLEKDGTLTHQIVELPNKQLFNAKLVPIDPHFPKWQYINKTSEREHVAHNHETDVVLFYDGKGKILEFDIGNVVVEEAGEWFTPPLEDDFLNGCMRQQLIDEGRLKIKTYQADALINKLKNNKAQIFLINSLREVADVQIKL